VSAVLADAPAAPPETRSVGRNLSSLAGGQLVTWTVTLLWTLVVPRALGPAGWGIFVSALSVSGVAGIVLGLGTRAYLVRQIVLDRDAGPSLVGTAVVLRLALAPLFVGCVVAYAAVAEPSGQARLVLFLVAGSTLLTLLVEPLQAGFQAMERMQYLAYSEVIGKSAQAASGILLVVLGFRAVGIATNLAVVAAAVIVLNAGWLRRFMRVELHTTVRKIRSMARESLAYWTFGVCSLLYLWLDTILLTVLTRPEVVGWYGAPTRLFQTLMFIPVLISTAWLPRLVAAFGTGEEELHRAARFPLELVLVLSVPVAAATAIMAGPMVHVLYGAAYANAVPVMVVLGLCVPPMYANILMATVVIAKNRQVAWTWIMAGATVVNPPINLVLIPFTEDRYGNGATGAAVSLLLTELLIATGGYLLVGRQVFTTAAAHRFALALLASAAMCGAFYAVQPLGVVPAAVSAGAALAGTARAVGLLTADAVALASAAVRARLTPKARRGRS
jgi:O-antigen/teichoic acid export membrane protein